MRGMCVGVGVDTMVGVHTRAQVRRRAADGRRKDTMGAEVDSLFPSTRHTRSSSSSYIGAYILLTYVIYPPAKITTTTTPPPTHPPINQLNQVPVGIYHPTSIETRTSTDLLLGKAFGCSVVAQCTSHNATKQTQPRPF